MAGASVSVPRSLRIRFWLLRSEVARARRAVLDLSVGRDAESLLRTFVCLLLGHGWKLGFARIQYSNAVGDTRKGDYFGVGDASHNVQLLRREDHHDPAAVHLGRLLQFGAVFQFFLQALDQLEAFIDVGVFAATEDDADDDLVFLGQELFGAVDLGHEVVVADLRAHPELFVLAVVRVAFVLPLFLLVLEFAVIHDAANGRLLLRRHLDEVKAHFASAGERVYGFENAEHFSFMSNNTDR